MFKVFVYGTLKQGHGNHGVMPSGAEYLGRGIAKGRMVSLGGFPGVLKDTEGEVHGEVWDVPEMNRLDSLEGNGSFYTREEKPIAMEGDTSLLAWIYLLPETLYSRHTTIENGEW